MNRYDDLPTEEWTERLKRESEPILSYGCKLTAYVGRFGSSREEMKTEVWVEMLYFAASHCRGNVHARQLSSGRGELLTHIWLLDAHMGMGEHCRE